MLETEKMPKLGFGMMRLPMKDGEIDIEQTKDMVDAAMREGKNYFDTAYMYVNGNSEHAVKAALTDRYPRESYYLADKFPVWMAASPDDKDRILEDQLRKTGAGYFDLYLLHSVEDSKIDQYEEFDAFNWGFEKKKEGKIKHFGFSFHGTPELLDHILTKYPDVEFVQIQYNYLDLENPNVQARKNLEVLNKHNKPVIIMEPVKGGTLANLDEPLAEKLKAVNPDDSVASWALRYVAEKPGVMTVLSGMSNLEQMEDNLKTFSDLKPLNEKENEALSEVQEILVNGNQIGCTACSYCTDGCPVQINIPEILKPLNQVRIYKSKTRPQGLFEEAVVDRGRPSECIACAQCEGVCPQHLPIIELLQEAAQTFES